MERTHGGAKLRFTESIGDSACFTVWSRPKLYERHRILTTRERKTACMGSFSSVVPTRCSLRCEEIHADLHADLVGTTRNMAVGFRNRPAHGREPVKFRHPRSGRRFVAGVVAQTVAEFCPGVAERGLASAGSLMRWRYDAARTNAVKATEISHILFHGSRTHFAKPGEISDRYSR